MGVRIGCDHLVYALMTTEDSATQAPTYGPVKSAIGVMSLNINPNGSQETLFADDGPMETASTLGKIEVEIQKAQLTTENKADLLGHTVDSRGALVYSDNDVAPWVAIGFRTLKSNGNYRYVWMYKGKFTEPEDNNETKGDSINFQNDTISGQFAKLNKEYTVGGKVKKPWKYELDQDYEGADPSMFSTWFDEVLFPSNVTISSIAVTTAPDKVAYSEGESFDPTGMVVTATYSDGSTRTVTGYTWAPDGPLEASDTQVIISYNGKTIAQAITVS